VISAVATSKLCRISLLRFDFRLSSKPDLALFLTDNGTIYEVLSPTIDMAKKYYSVSFSIDDIDYTVKLTDSNLSELAEAVQKGMNAANPLALFHIEALVDIQKMLNNLAVSPELKTLVGTDLEERWKFLQAVQAPFLESVADRNPNWTDDLSENQKEAVQAFKKMLVAPLPVVAPQVQAETDNDTIAA
jgi:hypothetical protein